MLNRDFEIEVWSRFVCNLWYELNPRVRCAFAKGFGNVIKVPAGNEKDKYKDKDIGIDIDIEIDFDIGIGIAMALKLELVLELTWVNDKLRYTLYIRYDIHNSSNRINGYCNILEAFA